MGFYSFITADTKRSVSNTYSSRGAFPVAMLSPDGRKWVEFDYEGYGSFCGKEFYELIAELNGLADRDEAIKLCATYDWNYDAASANGIKVPKIVENITAKYEDVKGFQEDCPDQGYFYSQR